MDNNIIRKKMPELDSIRGIAVLMVLLYHGLFWSFPVERASGITRALLLLSQPGWLGVQLFFVLSGFLITGILLDTRHRVDYYRRFYIRRVLRILPAYIALLLLLATTGIAGTPFLALSTVFLANVTTLFGVPLQYGPLWSLAVEEHFYIGWPALVRNLSDKGVLITALFICIIVPVLRAVAFQHGMVEQLYYYTWFTVDGLAMGAITAVLLRYTAVTRRTVAWGAGVLILLSTAAVIIGYNHGIMTRTRLLGASLQCTVLCMLFIGLLVVTLLVGSSPFSKLVCRPVLKFFGDISYGLYLVHMLAFRLFDRYFDGMPFFADGGPVRLEAVLIRLAVAGGAAVAVAALSRRYFEEYFLKLKTVWTDGRVGKEVGRKAVKEIA
ncbi:MAG: acyltransferase [bacterium]|nr:acyltransferase [bacterium]